MMTDTYAATLTRVVLIDDTPDIRDLLRMVLELSERYEVVGEAGDGATGIELVRQWQPDLVLLDLAMPVMDGLEALPAIRSVCPDASVVVLSGFEADRMAGQAMELGAAAYLQKGMRPDDMVGALDELIGKPDLPTLVAVPDPPLDLRVEIEPEDELAAAQAEVELMRSAVATAAHELRTPSTVLIGLAQTLIRRRDQLAPDRANELLDAIVRQATVLDRLTADLLISAQADRGELSAYLEQIDLVPATRAAAAALADQADVHLALPDSLQVTADPVRVQQMLTNLLSNALKYGSTPFTIVVRRDGANALVRIEDSGAGVAEDFRPHLFEQYARFDRGSSAGSGLGLYVVRALAEAQGGIAWYEPRLPVGASFCFTLPLA
jgi:signal transduction histidine kinase